MIYFLTIILFIIILWIALKYFKKENPFIEFPFLFSLVILGFALPQIISLTFKPNLPEYGLEKAVVMIIICTIALYYGYNKQTIKPFKQKHTFNLNKMLKGGIAASLTGGYFFWEISRLPQEITNVGQWTGLPVAYLFFAGFLSVGFTILLYVYFKTKNKKALLFILFDLLFYFDRIVIAGRRSEAVSLTLIILIILWFTNKKTIPKTVGIVVAVIGFLFITFISEYRFIMQTGWGYTTLFWNRSLPGLSEFSHLFYSISNFKETLLYRHSEMLNAVYSISIKDISLNFDYGLVHWNGLVHNFFPAQLFGADVKESLMFTFFEDNSNIYNYSKELSTSSPGIIDAFGSFWYFGVIKFYFAGLIIKKFYLSAVNNQTFPLILFPFVTVGGMLIVTHGTQFFIYSILSHILYLIPIYFYARSKRIIK
ncbi:MAG: hypothetical protein B6D44_16410 [Ignavibacteriales bacterium UTCHB2]|nr:MAG: hypothetical protein B6D44_16410 [Ignavibacteriales bacterium UTCHB2]